MKTYNISLTEEQASLLECLLTDTVEILHDSDHHFDDSETHKRAIDAAWNLKVTVEEQLQHARSITREEA